MRRLTWLALLLGVTAAAAAPDFTLARDGRALAPVVVGPQASERVRQAAQALADYLGRLSGAAFTVSPGDGATGLAVGLATDFPGLKLTVTPDPADPTHREDYLLRSHARGVYLLGASELAVEHAVWDCLYRLGYRQFFPGPHWEVIPPLPAPHLAVDETAHPDYRSRVIWYGYGTWPENRTGYQQWCARNRAVAGQQLNTGHAYEGWLHTFAKDFAAHPEWLALVKGQRQGPKFCLSNPDLRAFLVQKCLDRLAQDPTLESVSAEPSDGGGWCECEPCRALGSVTDRALTLANEIATAVSRQYPGKFVGMCAYNEHSPPPTIRVHPQVVISIATAFIRGGYTVDQLVAGWSGQGATLGIREYYGVSVWDRDLPGKPRAADLGYLARTLPQFHRQGARFLSAESSENWGPSGLGYYVAARLLWDVKEAQRLPQLRQDFLTRAFGPAAGPLGEFYDLLAGGRTVLLTTDLVGRMYDCLQRGRALTPAADVTARLDDLTLYTRYVELYRAYSEAAGPARQAAFEQLLRHVYRMRGTGMVHSLALYRDLPERDKAVTVPPEAAWNKPEPGNPWKSSAPFTRAELDEMLRAGLAANPQKGFAEVSFSRDLVPVTDLQLPAVPLGSVGTYGRHTQRYYTHFAAPGTLELKVTGGLIAHYRDRGNVRLTLVALDGATETPADRAEVPPDGNERAVSLKVARAGLHRLEVSDGGDATRVVWPAGLPWSLEASAEQPVTLYGRGNLYFYVPRGTPVVGGYTDGGGQLCLASGEKLLDLPARGDYFRAPVGAGQDGQLWLLRQVQGQVSLLTVPPWLARSAPELLLPREVVAAGRTQ